MTRPTRETPEGRAFLDLRALARRTGRTTAEVLQLFVLERFVARVAASDQRGRLVLKGGLLMAAFGSRRPTRDVDLLAIDMSNDIESIRALIADIAAIELGDGVRFDSSGVRARTTREGSSQSGVRSRLAAHLATAQVVFHVDVNVGDPVEPPARPTDLPTLLDEEPIRLFAYPIEMVVAEKLVTALERGGTNTRWRDFANLLLMEGLEPSVASTSAAIARVARHRGVSLTSFRVVRAELVRAGQAKWGVSELAGRFVEALLGREPPLSLISEVRSCGSSSYETSRTR